MILRSCRALLDRSIAAAFAPPCASCGEPLAHPLDGAVCGACWDAVASFTGAVCVTCGVPLPGWRAASVASGRCARCRRRTSPLTRQASIGPYEGRLRDILHALKYGRRHSVVPRLRMLLRDAGRDLLDDADACVPVPLHWRRRWIRGFNQAEWLADGLGVPMARLLRRQRWTAPQVGLPEAGRHRNVRDAFGWDGQEARRLGLPEGRLDRGSVLVLVDDVATTGATLEACARVLRAHGAGEVRALTAARAVRARPA